MSKILFLFITIIAIAFSYIDIQAWKYCLATIVILYCYKKVYEFQSKKILGISFSKNNILPFIIISTICAVLFNFYITEVISDSTIQRTSPLTFLLWFIQPLFQSFNEEVIFRAQYFHHIKKYITHKAIQSILFSIIFSLGHGVFFKFAMNIELNFNVYFSLFVATLIMNHLFFVTNNIALSWALHFGINFSFFGGKYFQDGAKLNDAEIFNLILGDEKILVPSIVALLIFLAVMGLNRLKAK